MVTPRILSVLQRVLPGNGGGTEVVTLYIFGVRMTSTDLVRLRVRLSALDHASICSSSCVLVWLLLAGIMTYVSSAYLDSKLTTLNDLEWRIVLILCAFFIEFDCFAGQLHHSG